MAQFDVFQNPGRRRNVIPFVVSLQSHRYDAARSRFVAALVSAAAVRADAYWLAPRFNVAGQDVVLDVFDLATIPATRLGTPVASLADEESRAKLVRALDEFLSQA